MSKPNTAGNSHSYEVAVIFDPSLDEKKASALLEKYLEVIKNDDGTVEKTDVWGKRTLAYPIQKKTEGVYIIVNANCPAAVMDEFTRRLGLDEMTLRFKVFNKDAK